MEFVSTALEQIVSTDWIRVNEVPPPLGFRVYVWNGEFGCGRPVMRKNQVVFLDASTSIPLKNVTHYFEPVAPDETA